METRRMECDCERGGRSSGNRAVNRGPVSFRFLSFLPPSTFRRAEIIGCENRKDREKYLSAKNVSLTRFSFRILGNFRSNRMQMNRVISFLLVYVRTALFLTHFNSARIPEFNRDNRHHAPRFLKVLRTRVLSSRSVI